MTVLMELEFPIRRVDVEELSRRMGVAENPPDGLVVHVAVETSNGLRVVDVWDSVADFERFRDTLLLPTAQAMMSERGMEMPAKMEPRITEAYDLVRGKSIA